MEITRFKGRPLIPGDVEGEVVVVESISFYGDVDPERGVLTDGRTIAGKIIVARKGKGSTVGPYILYTLSRKHIAPKAIILTTKSDPVIVAGAVLANITLIDNVPEDIVNHIKDGTKIHIKPNGEITITKQ